MSGSRTAHNGLRPAIAASAAVTLAGMLIGALLWDRLPAEIAVHFSFAGEPDGWESKAFTVFALPLMMLGFQAICVFCALRMSGVPDVLPRMVLWIVPVISLGMFVLLYAHALEARPDIGFWMQLTVGAVMIMLGNVMPKGAGSIRLGPRLQTLPPEAKQKIARFMGYCLVFGGVALCLGALAGSLQVFFAVVAGETVLPFVYALRTARSAAREG